ncbi:MAG: exopolysaccharide Pel transporter PelG [Hyphomicrobiaceae bacterium]
MAGAPGKLPHSKGNENLTGTIISAGRGTVIAVGPWLFTMAALTLISVAASQTLSRAALADFRGIIIYAFALSLIAAAPVVLVTSRVLSDANFLGRRTAAQPVMIAGVLGSGLASAILAWFVGSVLFELQSAILLALMQCSSLSGIMWVYLAIASTMRDYKGISATFMVGLMIATGATLFAVFQWYASTAEMVFAFNIGLASIILSLALRELRCARCPNLDIATAIRELARYTRRYAWIASGAVLGAIAVWIDKWIIWAGPAGLELKSGLMHAPFYDSAAFLAYLTIIPSLARFVMALDGEYITAYRAYFSAIEGHATLDEIDRKGNALARLTSEIIESNFLQQAAICAVVVLTAPLIIEATNLQYAQVPVLRLCAIAVLFQFVFLVATSLLIFFERHREFFLLQVMFLVLSAACTMITVKIGPLSYGFGILIASVISGIVANAVLINVVRNINFYSFIESAVRMHVHERDSSGQQPSSPNADWPIQPTDGARSS